jgi:polyhydroxybutyrate depolymerase
MTLTRTPLTCLLLMAACAAAEMPAQAPSVGEMSGGAGHDPDGVPPARDAAPSTPASHGGASGGAGGQGPIDAAPPPADPDASSGSGGAAVMEDAGVPPLAGSDGGAPAIGERSAGCAAANGLPEGEATLEVGGLTRHYRVRLPATYTNTRAWPLVLALHPNGGSGIGYWDATGGARPLRTLLADKAILIVPLARPMGSGWDWRGDLPADLAFFEALLTKVKDRLCVDTNRIFSMGFSGGASFSGVLGCRRSDLRAIAAGSGVAYFDAKDCVGAPAAWITYGDDEAIAARVAFRDFWATRAQCAKTSTPVSSSTCIAYACPPAAPVQFCTHPGGHLWPDFGTKAVVDFFMRL